MRSIEVPRGSWPSFGEQFPQQWEPIHSQWSHAVPSYVLEQSEKDPQWRSERDIAALRRQVALLQRQIAVLSEVVKHLSQQLAPPAHPSEETENSPSADSVRTASPAAAAPSAFLQEVDWIRREGAAYAAEWVALRAGVLVDHDKSYQSLHERLAAAGQLGRDVLVTKIE